jgi:hypothetical protein
MAEKSPLEVHVWARLDGQALDSKWAGRPVEQADAMIQRCPKVGNGVHLRDTCGQPHSHALIQGLREPVRGD